MAILSNLSTEYLQQLKKRFWAKVNIVDDGDSCWEWTASTNKPGYGQIGVLGLPPQGAHRISYELNVGPIPNSEQVCHTCDNPACVRPNHLFLGTSSDNMIDMLKKGRNLGKVTPAIVKQIRQLKAQGAKSKSIAQRFDIHVTHVNRILRGDVWGYV